MKPTSSKKPARLKEMLDAWKPVKPKTVQQASVKSNSPLPLIKPTKDHKLLRFHEPFVKEQPLGEAKAYDAKLAGTSLIVIDKSRTSAELKDIVDGFAKDCVDMSNDGHTVMGIAVAFDSLVTKEICNQDEQTAYSNHGSRSTRRLCVKRSSKQCR